MGLPIATRLEAGGFDVVGYDPVFDRPKLGDASVDVLVTVVQGPVELEDALVRDGGLAALRPGGLWLDLTSNAPDVAERVAALAADSGLASVGAPMGGGPSTAAAGTLKFFVGGDPHAIERAGPLLALLGKIDVVG